MRNGKLTLKFGIYIAAPCSAVWEALMNGSATKQYFYGCSVQSKFQKGSTNILFRRWRI
jgi:hypothetical protein